MKRIGLFVGAVAVVFLVVTGLAADRKNFGEPVVTPEVVKLREQMKSLEAKLAALTERVDKLEKERPKPLAYFKLPPNGAVRTPSLNGAFADPDRPPKIAAEREFNGWKYYLIPLGVEGR
jgi:hypothetical protein